MEEDREHTTQRNLLITVVLNVFITIAQISGGIISGSLALISDALHNFSDSLAIVLAWIANLLSVRPKNKRFTFGFQRAEILAAFINALVLVIISLFLIIEAVKRFIHLNEVDPVWMFWLGLLGLAANGISVYILHGGRKENINLKAAYLHLLGDMFTSLAVILGAIAIKFMGWYWIDPFVTIFISGYLLVQSFSILKESVEILMQMSPADIDTSRVGEALTSVEGILNVHHMHVWKLSDKKVHFEGHITLPADLYVSETASIHRRVKLILKEQFDIKHVTLQFEYKNKPEPECE